MGYGMDYGAYVLHVKTDVPKNVSNEMIPFQQITYVHILNFREIK